MTCQNIFDPVGNYLATSVHNGNGVLTSFAFTFPYLNVENWAVNSPNTASTTYNEYISVYVNGILTPYTMSNAYTIVLSTAPAIGDGNVVIRRNSSIAARKVDYVAGSVITEANLDRDSLQAFYLCQEMYDRGIDAACQIANSRYINSYLFDGTTTDPVDGSNAEFSLTSGTSTETNLLLSSEVLVLLNAAGQQARAENYTMSLDAGVCKVTFATAPVIGTKVEIRVLTSAIPQTLTLADNSVTTAKINNGAVTFPKINFDAVGTNGQVLFKRSGSAIFDTIATGDVSGLSGYITSFTLPNFALPLGPLPMNSQKITELGTPTNSGDAVNKSYVDGLFTTTYQPFVKIAMFTLTRNVSLGSATGVTTTCPFTSDFVTIWLDGDNATDRAGMAQNYYNSATGGQVPATPAYGWKTYKTFTWAELASPVDFTFSPLGAKINVSRSGNDVTCKFYGPTTNGTTCQIKLELYKNSPSV